jgi:monofunctional glycosyltransferase
LAKKVLTKTKNLKNRPGKVKINRKRKGIGRTFLKYIIILLTLLFTVSIIQVVLLKWVPPFYSSFMLINKFELMLSGKPAKIHYEWKPYEEISEFFPLAVIAAEDQRFPDHAGFDFNAIETAIKENQEGTRIRGGSTISQQVAKNLFCWPQRSYFRKSIETYYTVLIELIWNKKRILEVYINVAELGPQIYGVEAASRAYFNKPALSLSRDEASLLAAVLPSPQRYSAKNPSSYVLRRSEWIKNQMNQLGDKKFLKKI